MSDDSYGSELAMEQMINEHIAEMEADARVQHKEWLMANGKVVKIKDMETSHIKNCINMIERNKWNDKKRLTEMLQEELAARG